MRRPPSSFRPHRQHGFVLVTALIFLVVLTLIGVVATKNTTLGLKMSKNFLEKTQTFEAAETARVKIDDLVDSATYNRGWPSSMGGTVADADFDTGNGFYGGAWPCSAAASSTTGATCSVTLLGQTNTTAAASSSNQPWVISDGNQLTECIGPTLTTPTSADNNSCPAGNMDKFNNLTYEYDGSPAIYGYVSIYKLGVANAPGSGAAMISGYEGTGKGAAGAGAMVFYYLRSRAMVGGVSFTPTGTVAFTGADYRAVIR